MIQTISIEDLGTAAPGAHCAFVRLPVTDFENAHGVLMSPSLSLNNGWFQYKSDDDLQDKMEEVLTDEQFEDDEILVLVVLDTQPLAGAPGFTLPRIYLCPFELLDAEGSDEDDEEEEEGGNGYGDPGWVGGVGFNDDGESDDEEEGGEEEDDDEEEGEDDEDGEEEEEDETSPRGVDWLDED